MAEYGVVLSTMNVDVVRETGCESFDYNSSMLYGVGPTELLGGKQLIHELGAAETCNDAGRPLNTVLH